MLAYLLQQQGVVGRVADGGHAAEVAGRSRQQREATDVDHLHGLVDGHHAPADLWREGADGDDHDVERRQAVLGETGHVLGHVPAGEDAGVDRRVVRLDLAADELRHVRQLGDRRQSLFFILAFALQDTLGNLASGLMIMIDIMIPQL